MQGAARRLPCKRPRHHYFIYLGRLTPLSPSLFGCKALPRRHIGRQQALEQFAMIGHVQVEQLVDDDKIAEAALAGE